MVVETLIDVFLGVEGRKKQAKWSDLEQETCYHLVSTAYVMTETLFVQKGFAVMGHGGTSGNTYVSMSWDMVAVL